jgi:HEAT repeat protein
VVEGPEVTAPLFAVTEPGARGPSKNRIDPYLSFEANPKHMAFLGFGAPDVQGMANKTDVKGLIKALRYKDAAVRAKAAGHLGAFHAPRAVEPLIAALRDPDAEVRMSAAIALGKIGDARAVTPLLASLREDTTAVRVEAARALGLIGDPRAIEPLRAAFRDEPSLRETADEALRRLGLEHKG